MNIRQMADAAVSQILQARLRDIYGMMEADPPRCECKCHREMGHCGDKVPISIGKFCGKNVCLDCAEASVAESYGHAVEPEKLQNQRPEEN